MNYDLAKKLKGARFPLSMSGFDDHCRMIYMPDAESVERHERNYAYKPTLSELIEACDLPTRFFNLSWRYGQWRARLFYSKTLGLGVGSTPEEAVANLWLALNTK